MPAEILIVRPEDFPAPRLRDRTRRQFRQIVRGGVVRPHVQAFADACKAAGVASSFGTYPGHQPELALALDIFHPLGDRAAARRICDFAFAHWEPSGCDYAISFNEIWNPEIGRYWRSHRGGPTPTARHEDHVHISFEPTGAVIGRPRPTPTPTPPTPEEEADMVLIWHKGALYLLNARGRTPWGLTPHAADALKAAGVRVGGNPNDDQSNLFEAIDQIA